LKTIPEFSKILLDWFDENQRTLPWRGQTAPYKIWISEIILQQTRVNQGWNYYLRFMDQFPDVKTLGDASLQEVLKVWQGLGYYSRARNLHTAAQQIMQAHHGIFPENYVDIRKLKGIGDYTAAAISSIAFQLPYPAVDGNVLRVITRIFGIYDDVSQPVAVKKITQLCEKMIDKVNPGNFNQALMEFGAIHCTPKNPKCDACPFGTHCVANKQEHQTILPLKLLKTKIKERYFHYYIFLKENKTLIEQRLENDIWKNLYQFPMIETENACELIPQKMIFNAGFENCKPIFLEEIKHKLSHQHLTIRFYVVNDYFPVSFEKRRATFLQTIPVENLEKYPFPVVIGRIVGNILNN
jgi:A/G-specific adenine glycosylase